MSLHEKYKDVLTPAAQVALEPLKSTTLWEVLGQYEFSRSIYLSATAHSPEGVDKAARLIYAEVNKLAELGVLQGHLCKLSMLILGDGGFVDLHEYLSQPGAPSTYAVFCFPHVDADWDVTGTQFSAEEGSIGIDIEPEKAGGEPVHSPECSWCKHKSKVLKFTSECVKLTDNLV